ncbi:hypothetical protein GLYMA_08G241000v4 [Glycine max]|uniref:chorismate mutase n=2 Tax=Glycine max TaxID=3847 RepID=A0A0R0IRR3_SOYBN|nr:chorismate mutase 1, chloroplastic isoform X1 [Glycine max]KAG5026383.1 hypothetical protein JHK86_022297 [Glycine max]KAH1052845.1 hypothetical protein GYH30_022232 [Glycine max]KAH1238393.1 Chorismate mutase 1, chloroplastic [Glycine max]KRH44951.1 hypothetical protein GLYMA_08G241000v4 [Glycine max]|eukprot:XP_003530417.2 chorismate mutase 1, chloroplastic isoform X1 [Glycine max]
MSMKFSSSSVWSRKEIGYGDDGVIFTTSSNAKYPEKMFRISPNWKAEVLRATMSPPPFPLSGSSTKTHRACFPFNPISWNGKTLGLSLQAFPPSSSGHVPSEKSDDGSENLTLESIRRSLIRQEDSIIYSLLKRAQHLYNAKTYDPEDFSMDGFHGSLVEYLVRESEKLHAKVGRYMCPDEHPFFPHDLPESMLPCHYAQVLHHNADSININDQVWMMYFGDLIPRLAKEGDDGHYESTSICDIMCLQALSKRIHYGKFVAEAKFQANPDNYKDAILAQDKDRLMDMLTYPKVEEENMIRVEEKAKKFGLVVDLNAKKPRAEPLYIINPSVVSDLYGHWVMPLTKEVQVAYLLRRLD